MMEYGPGSFKAAMGAEVIRGMLQAWTWSGSPRTSAGRSRRDLDGDQEEADEAAQGDRVLPQVRQQAEWMILDVIPVIPRSSGRWCPSKEGGSRPPI